MVKTNPSFSQVIRVAIYGLAGLQFLFQVTPAFAGVFQADEQSVAQTAVEAGRVQQGSNRGYAARQMLTSQASGQAADAVTQWLNQFGTAKTQLSVDSYFSLKGSSLDVLFPLYNTPKNVLFTQLGMRDNDGRFTPTPGLATVTSRITAGCWDTTCFMTWTGATPTAATGLAWKPGVII